MPVVVRFIGQLLPATYYIELLKTLFLAGNVWPLIAKDCAILCLHATVLLGGALAMTKKRLH